VLGNGQGDKEKGDKERGEKGTRRVEKCGKDRMSL
jgi:hypothetical protein